MKKVYIVNRVGSRTFNFYLPCSLSDAVEFCNTFLDGYFEIYEHFTTSQPVASLFNLDLYDIFFETVGGGKGFFRYVSDNYYGALSTDNLYNHLKGEVINGSKIEKVLNVKHFRISL